MSEYIHMRHGNASQRKELLDLLDMSFGFTRDEDKFINLLPKLYKEKYNPAQNNVVLDVNGEIRAAVGLYYSNLTVCGEKLKISGIGNVAVHPDHRNKGYMGFCMALCLDEMKQNMTDMGFLSGQRQRYGRYSYEQCGLQYSFFFNKKNVRYKCGKDKKAAYDYREIAENDTEIFSKIADIYNSRPFKAVRQSEDMYDILCSWKALPYAVLSDGEFKGWFVLNRSKTYVYEMGYANKEDIEEIIICALEASEKDSIEIVVPPFEAEVCDYLGKNCEYYRMNQSIRYTIFSYENVLRAFLKLKSTYTFLADGECVMLIEGIKLPEQIKITVKDNAVSVEETDEKPDIILKHDEAMRLVGSLYSERRNELKPECASWFPLPFYTYSMDEV
ncbi:MAG: GNAT family N-acetyltransferase [Clostridiales bacterium]|nr:GNAT family N-acetyltransferase [Clostridiales bacterium]